MVDILSGLIDDLVDALITRVAPHGWKLSSF